MTPKKIASILSLIEISQNNLKTAKEQLLEYAKVRGVDSDDIKSSNKNAYMNPEETGALEVMEGYFNGEAMVGDNGKTYPVPPNYASKTQLVVGDRMKWILTSTREIFKLIAPVDRERVVGEFTIINDEYVVQVKPYDNPVRILKASATFAMKNLGLQPGDKVAIMIPKDGTPVWGALSSVVGNEDEEEIDTSNPYSKGNEEKVEEKKEKTPADLKTKFDAKSFFDEEYL